MTVQTAAEEYAGLLARAAPFLKPVAAGPTSAYGRTAVTGDEWLRAAAEPFLRGLPTLPGWDVRKFNPGQPRDGDGQWSDGVPGTAIKDALKLAGKIDLAPGERLVGSAKVDGDSGGVRLALTERGDGQRMLRFGGGGDGYGQRDRDRGTSAWDGNPSGASMSADDRARLEAENGALDEEWETASPARKAEIEARQDDVREQLGAAGGFNGTANLDTYGMRRLVDRIRPALAEAVDQERRQNRAYDELEVLRATAAPDPVRVAELSRIARVDETDFLTFDRGIVAGSEWGDVHFSVFLDDPSVGAEVRIGVAPKGAPDDWGDDQDWEATFDAAETSKLLRLLDKFAAA